MFQEVKFDLSVRMSMEVQDLTVQVEHSKNFVDNTVSIIKDIFNNYSVLADIFLVRFLLFFHSILNLIYVFFLCVFLFRVCAGM